MNPVSHIISDRPLGEDDERGVVGWFAGKEGGDEKTTCVVERTFR
jgi:hypothetical protein